MHKIAFQFGSLTISWYGILVATGFLAGLWNASRRAVTVGIPAEQILDLGPWLVIGGIVGARLLYVVSYWSDYFSHQPFWEIFMVHHGGLVYYGGLFGAVIGGYYYLHRKRMPFLKTADILAPSLALGHAIGRVGCLMNGCCYGRPTPLPWAIHFPAGHETCGVGVHPAEIYDTLANLGLFLALAWLFGRKKFDGWIFALYLIGYSVMRTGVEIFRGDYNSNYWKTISELMANHPAEVLRGDYHSLYQGGHFTPAQLVSVGVFAAGVGLWGWRFWRQRSRAKHEGSN